MSHYLGCSPSKVIFKLRILPYPMKCYNIKAGQSHKHWKRHKQEWSVDLKLSWGVMKNICLLCQTSDKHETYVDLAATVHSQQGLLSEWMFACILTTYSINTRFHPPASGLINNPCVYCAPLPSIAVLFFCLSTVVTVIPWRWQRHKSTAYSWSSPDLYSIMETRWKGRGDGNPERIAEKAKGKGAERREQLWG